jgi:methyl-accepting chemotaxis protein
MENANHHAEQQRAAKRQAEMHALAGEFEKSVQQIAKELTDAVAAMHNNAEAMSLIAAEARDKSQSTAGIVIDTQTDVDSVANAADELARSIEHFLRKLNMPGI